MKLSELKVNPNNPQKYEDEDIDKLANSIKDFPKMMKLRPIVFDPETNFILGGNKRLIALQRLGYKEIPDEWVKSADELTEEEKHRFIVQDNISAGTFDFQILADGWGKDEVETWGLEWEEEIIPKERKDLSDKLGMVLKIEIEVITETEQEELFNEFTERGYKCRILTL